MAKCCSNVRGGYKLAQLVEAMCYTPEGCGFDSDFSLT